MWAGEKPADAGAGFQAKGVLEIVPQMAPVQKPLIERFLHRCQSPVNLPPDPGGLDVTDGCPRNRSFSDASEKTCERMAQGRV